MPVREAMEAFHRQRIGFFVIGGLDIRLMIDYPGTHEEFAREKGIIFWKSLARGFYWPKTNELFFYTGDHTFLYESVTLTVFNYSRNLISKVGGNEDTKIYGGMIPGEPGTVWAPIHYFGTRQELRYPRS